MYRETMIAPNGMVYMEENEKPYQHSKFFKLNTINNDKATDVKLPDGSYIHTKNTEHGCYVLVVREIKNF